MSDEKTRPGKDMGYAGDLTPLEAWQRLGEDENAVLIDVRTEAEWQFVGMPDLSSLGKEPLLVQWLTSQGANPSFVQEVRAHLDTRGVSSEATLLFLCRSGVRSKNAAIACTDAGYPACYNIATGFEGDLDQDRHRNSVNGWRIQDLPWSQG